MLSFEDFVKQAREGVAESRAITANMTHAQIWAQIEYNQKMTNSLEIFDFLQQNLSSNMGKVTHLEGNSGKVNWSLGDREISLNGRFSADELFGIACWLKSKNQTVKVGLPEFDEEPFELPEEEPPTRTESEYR